MLFSLNLLLNILFLFVQKVNIRPMRFSDFFVPEGSVLQSTKNTVTSPGEVEQEQLD